MKRCDECQFMIDYGEFLYCEVKHKIIRHEKRDALLCLLYKPIFNDLDEMEEFLETLKEFLDNYPGGDDDEEI